MVAGRRFYRTGLLIFLFFCAVKVSAQSGGSAVAVSVYPQIVNPGIPFTMTFIVDYPNPDNVSVITPQLPAAISLDRIVIYPQTHNDGRAFTIVEYRMIISAALNQSFRHVTFESFMIHTPAGITETGSFILNINIPGTEQRVITQQLIWENVPNQITTGERITLILRTQTGTENSRTNLPQPSFFMPQVPPGVILSPSNISASERTAGLVLKLTLIPLSPGSFNLPARSLLHENTRYEIPALNIRIN